ncbi:MAG: hypothetical protein CMH32_08375 [Micavibrio sp.]|nr:hypothetical protein [Micavibrio sp.]|tara:strand:+ start:476 stop:1381 length:906 start_codon:yes stop_codon:yes gene_type:complete
MTDSPKQSTDHIALIRPAVFFANPETMPSNPYQDQQKPVSEEEIYQQALKEFNGFHQMLLENGITVTVLHGHPDCPDHIFPNFLGTHEKGQAILYPMATENRAKERTPEIMSFIHRHYEILHDLTVYEQEGKALEANASVCLDRVNKIGYAALSSRTHKELALEWGRMMGYEIVICETALESGLPVYHTDLVMFIGNDFACVCFDVMTSGTEEVRKHLERSGKEIIEISLDQLNHMCGNALQVLGKDRQKYLIMSSHAYEHFTEEQLARFHAHVDHIIHAPIPTIERYGGGSARCLIQELF